MVEGINNGNNHYIIKHGDNLTKIARANNTTVKALLKLNPSIKNPNKIYIGNKLILSEISLFKQRIDYDPQKLNVGEVTVNGTPIHGEFKSNYFANQTLDKLGEAGDIVNIELKVGKDTPKADTNAYSIANKVISKYLNLSNEIITDSDGTRRTQNQKETFESTDFYKAMISEEVNGNNFDAEGNLVANENGNKVQLPTVGKDSDGKTYFVLHSGNKKQYFDSTTGKRTEFKDGKIISKTSDSSDKRPEIAKGEHINEPDSKEFKIPAKYNEKQLNLGQIFINGVPIEADADANYFRNQVKNNFTPTTLNDGKPSRLDVQLKPGNNLNPRYDDNSADEILSSHLANNCDKIAIYQQKNKPEALALLRKTDLYNAMVSKEVNGDNFVDGKLKTPESGFNTVQLPALEADAKGTKYYVLHTADKVLYFNDKGQAIEE